MHVRTLVFEAAERLCSLSIYRIHPEPRWVYYYFFLMLEIKVSALQLRERDGEPMNTSQF